LLDTAGALALILALFRCRSATNRMEVSALLQREVNVSRYVVAELRDQLRRGSPFLKRVMAAPKHWVVGGPGALRRIAA
jgi:hypothetical protein